MNHSIKKLLQFCIGPVSGAIISFITIPIITHFLLPEEIGKASMFTLFRTLVPIMFLGLDQAFVREFFAEEQKENLLLNAIAIPLGLSILLFVYLSINALFFSRILFGQPDYVLAIRLIGILAVTSVLERFILSKIRMEGKALEHSILVFALKASAFFLIVFFIIFIRTDFLTIVYATVIGELIIHFVLIIRYFEVLNISKLKINPKLSKKMLIFGLPLAVSIFLESLLKMFSTATLRYFGDFEQLGLFSTGSKVANLLLIISMAFSLFWKPTAYKWYEENREIKAYQEVSDIVLAVMSLGFITLLFARPLINIFVSEQFDEIQYFIGFLSFYPFMHTLTLTTMIGVAFSRKSYLNILVILVSLLVNISLNLLLVPQFGALGASISIGISYIIYFLLFTFFSFYVWKKFPVKKHLLIIFLMLSLTFVDLIFTNLSIYAKVMCLIIFFFIHKETLQLVAKKNYYSRSRKDIT